MDLSNRIEMQLRSLERNSPAKLSIVNGTGEVLCGPPFTAGVNEKLDYFILLGEASTHTIYRFLTKIKIGGILVVEVTNKDHSTVKYIVDFLNSVAHQHASSFRIDGIPYIFITRLES